MTKRIVILGGGFAGTNAALHLEKRLRRDPDVEVVLLDAENFSTFTPLLAEVPSGSVEAKHIVFPLRALLRRTVVRQAEVLAVDVVRRVVTARHCGRCARFELAYDHLVVAVGGVTNFYGTPGVAEHALTMKSLADATTLHAHVVDRLEHADLEPDPAARRALLTFVVAGGGFAGVETIAELNDFVRGAGRFYPRVDPAEVRVLLVHSGRRVLPEVSESLSAYALGKLRQRGVEVLLGTRVVGCDAASVTLSTGEAVPSRTLVWAAGVAPSPLLDRIDLPRTPAGRVEVDATLAVLGRDGVWAIGDGASVPDAVAGGFCPPTAQYAQRQGRCLAENVAAALRGGPPREFRHTSQGVLAGLGRRCAVAEVFGLQFSGFFAWWLWRTIYLMKLPGFERKVRVALDWTLDLFFPRDIIYLRPLHEVRGLDVAFDPPAGPESCPATEAAEAAVAVV